MKASFRRRRVGVFGRDFHLDAGFVQAAESLPGNLRIRIFHGGDYLRDPGENQRRRRAACGRDGSRARA